MSATLLPRSDNKLVLLVDDMPDNLKLLSSALDSAGYTVLVALDGASALERVNYVTPDIILLDAVMPSMDGFETCRRLKTHRLAAQVPVVFMTALTDPEDVVRGFHAGGIDYVTKPLEISVVLARIESHLRHARMMSTASQAIDAAAHAVVVLDTRGNLVWETRRARHWLNQYFGPDDEASRMPAPLAAWILDCVTRHAMQQAVHAFSQERDGQRLDIRFASSQKAGEFILLLEENPIPRDPMDCLASAYQLTQRERDVLTWVAKGKTNRDVSDILGMSPRTVNKHLEHIFVKLGVETRAAATALVLRAAQRPGAGMPGRASKLL